MLQVPCRILIGPLYNPGVLGAYAASPEIKVFMYESAHSQKYAYDLVYPLEQVRHFNQIFDYLPPDWEPELVIWWDPVYQPLPPGLEDCPYPTALIPGDWNLSFLNVLQVSQRVNAVFADTRLSAILRQAGIEHVFPWQGFAFDSSQIYFEPGLERIYDICFIGNMNPSIHPQRSRYLAQVLQLQDQYRLFLRHGVWGDDYRHALNQSRIVLNYTICQVLNMRAYEAPACKALLFIEEENLEVRSVFEDRVSCILYNEHNLLELLVYYLEHEEERARIAEAGYQTVQAYSYEQQFERLLAQIPALLSQAWRPALTRSPARLHLLALNQIAASNPRGAYLASEFLQKIWTQLSTRLLPERVWELNALLVMLFPYFDENQLLKPVYSVSLQELLQGFELALSLNPDNPVLRYHHGLVCEYLGDQTQALWSYSYSVELMASGHRDELLEYRDFILPFNKSGRGTDQLAFEWERVSYQGYETHQYPNGSYVRLLSSSIWQRIGRILSMQANHTKALIAYQNAYENFPRASLLLEIARLQPAEEALETFNRMIGLQPLLLPYLSEILGPEQLISHADWVLNLTRQYLPLFPELNKLKLLAELVLAEPSDRAPDEILHPLPVWQAFLNLLFSEDFYQWLCRVLQTQELNPELARFQVLRQPLGLGWELAVESAPELSLNIGFYWDSKASLKFARSAGSWQRVYDSASDLSLGICGPDVFPFRFPTELSRSNELVDELKAGFKELILVVLSEWSAEQLRQLLAAYESHWSAQPECLLLLWSPPGCQLSLAELERLMPQEAQAQISWLDEALTPSEQGYLLCQANLILASPRGLGLFYSYWASSLQIPVVWMCLPGWLPDQGRGGFGLPAFADSAQALAAYASKTELAFQALPRHWLDPDLKQQAWLNGLWQLRLWQTFAPPQGS